MEEVLDLPGQLIRLMPLPGDNRTCLTQRLRPNTPTMFTVTVTGGACTVIDSVFLNVGGSLPLNQTTVDITCNGAGDGNVDRLP